MPTGPVSVIEKVVIMFLENHTLDNLASEVAGVDGDTTLPLAPDVVTADPPHDHPHWMQRDKPFGQGGARRERYGKGQLPAIYGLMEAFTTCDRYFSDVATNSFPNHAFAIGADAEESIANPHRNQVPFLQTPGVPVRLEGAGKTWANYGNGFAFKYYVDSRMRQNVRAQGQFQQDAAAGRLPDVSWVYAPAHQDFHPGPVTSPVGSSMSASDAWLGAAVAAVATGKLSDGRPLWDHVAVFVTFDDWGGWSDHVVPPVVERVNPADPTFPNDPYRYGSRVPCVVVSPYAKARYVSHVTSSHTSLVAFIERLWGLPPSPNPKAQARTTSPTEMAMADCIDVTQAPLAPPVLAVASRPPRTKARMRNATAKSAPAKSAAVKKAPVKSAPAKRASVKRAALQNAPAKGAPAKRAAVKRAALQKAPAKGAPAKRAAVKLAAVKKAPAKGAPANSASVKRVAVKKAPAKPAPATSSAAKKAPANAQAQKAPSANATATAKKATGKKATATSSAPKKAPATAKAKKATTTAKSIAAKAAPAKKRRSPNRPSSTSKASGPNIPGSRVKTTDGPLPLA